MHHGALRMTISLAGYVADSEAPLASRQAAAGGSVR